MPKLLLPDILSYPEISLLQDVKPLQSRFVYIIEKYPEEGIVVSVFREGGKEGDVLVRIGDFQGNLLDANDANSPYAEHLSQLGSGILDKLLLTIRLMSVGQCMFYLSMDCGKLRLVDIRLSPEKFTGPGYIQDIFAQQKILSQKIFKVIQLDEEIVQNILEGKYDYTGEYIIKPSAFKTTIRDEKTVPLYGKVVR